jgi:hypothetical protein
MCSHIVEVWPHIVESWAHFAGYRVRLLKKTARWCVIKRVAGVFPRIHPEEKTPALKNADIHMLRKALGITPNWSFIIFVRSVSA